MERNSFREVSPARAKEQKEMKLVNLACALCLCVSVPALAGAQAWEPYPPVAVATSHGWYDAGFPFAELYWRGEYVGKLNLSTGEWITAGKDAPVNLRETFAPGRAMCCCSGKCLPVCECEKCPDGCKEGCKCKGCSERVFFGVDDSKRSIDPRYSKSGQDCCRREVEDALRFDDESGKRRITIIGDDAYRKEALAVIGSPQWAVVKAYSPDNWYVRESGFRPGVYVQEADGTVIHRQEDLAKLSVAVNRADPSYDPSKDPDLRNSEKPGSGDCSGFFCWKSAGVGGIVAALIALAIWLLPKLSSWFRKRGMERQAELIDAIIEALKKRQG